jgi:hypothetical protein
MQPKHPAPAALQTLVYQHAGTLTQAVVVATALQETVSSNSVFLLAMAARPV